MKEFIEFIAKHIVDNPDNIKCEEIQQEDGSVLIRLTVSGGETGKVIGKHGKTAQAIRVLLGTISRKAGKKAVFEILD